MVLSFTTGLFFPNTSHIWTETVASLICQERTAGFPSGERKKSREPNRHQSYEKPTASKICTVWRPTRTKSQHYRRSPLGHACVSKAVIWHTEKVKIYYSYSATQPSSILFFKNKRTRPSSSLYFPFQSQRSQKENNQKHGRKQWRNWGDSFMVCSQVSQHQPYVLFCPGIDSLSTAFMK